MHLLVDRFVTPDEFKMYKEEGLKMGFKILKKVFKRCNVLYSILILCEFYKVPENPQSVSIQ